MTTKKLLRKNTIVCLVVSWFAFSCKEEKLKLPDDYELATSWADMTNYITKTTPANSPTFASRCFGYIGLTMYESVVNGYPEYQSIAAELNGLGNLPLPEKGKAYNWKLVLNSAQSEIISSIYIQTSAENKNKIDSLEHHFETLFKSTTPDDSIVRRSIIYGKKIAKQIFEWSKTDGGHRGYLNNFDKKLVFENKPGGWKPPLFAQSFSHYPLHPHWGRNRTFLSVDSAIAAPEYIPYDTLPSSAYYQQFMQVYEKRKVLTQAEKEAAIWWSDDPDVTFTPPGHSYYLATLAIRKTKPNLVKCAETYARVGMAVADAFRNCWKWKYQFFTERANTFIPQHVDQQWESFWPDPPFPAFPSGHAIQAAAAATVLTDLYGDHFEFTDSAHVGRPRDELRNTEFKARHFKSFWEAAEETAMSRFYGGIHIPQDNARGLEKGKIIADNINRLNWKRPKS
ncbi:vanadium-dependent haloperoxidase [Flavihumibacter profundi]|uniref:vanadium-dependent haloperoxidase n=1 Tax=Flavihumibacter profundi TaxID=2716883 RepID=UPI001CC71021|nr:vanadium-dependent haloperoxidase [Flavihumibacter profundi]MBZ5858944.1 vanadium-dependent haloperoxidase [Flavihumibacter profundi]